MLVLRHGTDDTITIDVPPSTEPIKIKLKVIGLNHSYQCGRTVQLGYDAPRNVLITRDNAINKQPATSR